MVSVAGAAVECDWMDCHVGSSGVHVQDAACWGVNVGGSLVLLTQSGSMAPIRIFSPCGRKWREGGSLENAMSMVQESAEPSRHRKVGGVMPGGKIDPSSG